MGFIVNAIVLTALCLLVLVHTVMDMIANYVETIIIHGMEHVQELQILISKQFQDQSEINQKSMHIWAKDLSIKARYHLTAIATEVQSYLQQKYKSDVMYLHDMTEINASGTIGSNSDKIYFTRHFDAPFGILPCQIVRVLVAINGTPDTSTVFNNKEVALATGQAAIFDYDRASHYIRVSSEHPRSAPRITAKMQFYIPLNPVTQLQENHNWCMSIHDKWSVYSRSHLVHGQEKSNWKVYIGIMAAYVATFMKYVALLCAICYIFYMMTKHVIFFVIFSILTTYVVCYYVFVLYLLFRFIYS